MINQVTVLALLSVVLYAGTSIRHLVMAGDVCGDCNCGSDDCCEDDN